MNFDGLKALIRQNFPDKILVSCSESDSYYYVTLYPNNAEPITLPGDKRVWMAIGCDYLVNKKTRKVEQVPNLLMIPKSMVDRVGKLREIYRNEAYSDV